MAHFDFDDREIKCDQRMSGAAGWRLRGLDIITSGLTLDTAPGQTGQLGRKALQV